MLCICGNAFTYVPFVYFQLDLTKNLQHNWILLPEENVEITSGSNKLSILWPDTYLRG
jgi:hypothetical protein